MKIVAGIAIMCIIAMIAFGAIEAGMTRSELENTKNELAERDKTIEQLKKEKADMYASLEKWKEDYIRAEAKHAEATRTLEKLIIRDPEARNFLSGSVPDTVWDSVFKQGSDRP